MSMTWFGNRTTQTATITSTQVTNYAYDAANRLSSVNGQPYTWDDNGNLLNDGATQYAYDQANRLISATLGTTSTLYTYNADGARVKQIVNGSPTTYTLDLAAPLVQVLSAKDNSSETRYLYGLTRIGEQQSTSWVYHVTDALGSVRQLADANAQVVLTRGYTPYGEPLWSKGTGQSAYGYTGEALDVSTGLVFLRARYMNPQLGMFTSRDPWNGDQMRPGSTSGWNYVEGNPINETDPLGLCKMDPNFNLFGIRRCFVEPEDGIEGFWGIARQHEVDFWALLALNGAFNTGRGLTGLTYVLLPRPGYEYVPNLPPTPQPPTPQPQQPIPEIIHPGWMPDGYVDGDSTNVTCVYYTGGDGEVHTWCPNVTNCPDGVIGAGSGNETLMKLQPDKNGNYEVARYQYRYAIYGKGVSTGEIGTEHHWGFVSGFARGFGFSDYSGLAVCRNSSITGELKVLGIDSILQWQNGGASGLQAGACGPGPQGKFEGIPNNGPQDGFWSITLGLNLYLTAFTTASPTTVLTYYDQPWSVSTATSWDVQQAKIHGLSLR